MDMKRIAEAEECMRNATKHMKTSLMKWKPDFDSAAVEYDRAAVCFKNANANERCMNSYIQAAECHEKNGNKFHSAKSKENATLMAEDLGLMEKAKVLMEEASQMYAESGTASL